MPYSYDYFKIEFHTHLKSYFNADLRILDVGAGCGTYGKLLRNDFDYIDAVEIFEPYIEQFKLNEIYNYVFNANIIDINMMPYEYVIMGDVIEHMSIKDSTLLLNYIQNSGKKCMVAIPYLMKQDAVGGNIYEIHKQDDLTHKVFIDRFPMMHNLFKNEHYGLYINY